MLKFVIKLLIFFTFGNYTNSLTETLTTMKKITLCFFMMILPMLGFSQINEGFEGASFPPTTPGNWAVLNNGVGTGIEWAETTTAAFVHSGTKAAIIDRENIGAGNTSQDWLITPQVTLPANGQLRFWTRQTLTGNNGSTYEIRVSTDPSQTNQAAFTTVQTWTETTLNATFNVYEEKLVSLSGYAAGTQVYIAFVKINTQPSTATTGDRWIIDDVNLVQQCLDPSILTAAVTGPTTATLGWTNNGSATLWDIYYNLQPDSTVPDVSTTPSFDDVGTTSYPATGFSPGTSYKFWVRAQCAGGVVSNWVGPFNFTTNPAGSICSSPILINTLPYSHTANTSTYGDFFDTPQGAGCAGGATNYLQGAEVFYSYTPTVSGNITISMTPGAASSSIFVYNGCANVGVTCLAGVADTTSNIRNIATLAVTAGQTYIIVISSSTTPAAGIPYTLVIQEKFCDPPTGGTTANPTTTSVEMSWANPSAATSWQVTVQAPGSGVPTTPGPLTQTANTNTSYVFNGLTAATPYEYWVRADCGGGLFSPWAGPYLFSTAICDPADRCNYTFRMTDSYGDGWNGARMEIRQNGVVVATIGSTFTTGAGPINIVVPLCQNYPFELHWTVAGSFPSEVGVSVINNFNQTLFTKPSGTGSAPSLLYTTSFSCSEPACLVPLALNDTTPTTYGATLTWNANGGTNWDIYIVPTGSPAPTATSTPTVTNVTSTTYVIPASLGLLPNTTYQYYIRTVCSPTQQSGWAGPGDFTTLPTCSRPTGPNSSNITASSATLSWTQPNNPDGSLANAWQIILLPCGSPVPTAATPGWISVNTNTYNVLGLTPLTCYDFYVRAICSPTDASPVSVVHTFFTPDTNDECANSKEVPVNQNTHCIQTVFGTVAGATASPQANTCGATADNDDVWFHFVATATTHYISLLEPVTSTANPPAFPTAAPGGLNYSLYRGSNCGSLVQVSCRTANGGMETGLVIGETYKIRVYSPGTAASTKRFEVCVGTKVIYCENSIPVCAVNAVILRNDVGVPANPNPISGTATTTVGCLGSAPSPTFYFLTVQQDGNYTYFMEQSTNPTFATVDLDVDYVTWGPFTSVAQACASISVSNTRPAPQGCSFSAAATETFTLNGALAGQVYIMMITNYTASSSYPGKRGYIRITRTSGPAPLECCPFANFTYSSSFFCKDGANPSPILGTASTAGTYTASSPNLVINPTTGVIDLAASTVGTYTVTSTIPGDADCPTSTATFSVTISNPQSATISYAAASFCRNNTVAQPVTVTGSTNGFFSTSPASGLSINPTTGAITPSTSTPGLYTVIYTIPAASGCPAFTTQTQVTIDALPVGTFNYGTAPYCSNGGFANPVFTGGGVAGTFTSTPGLVIDSSTGVIDLAASTIGTYTVTNEIAANGACPIVSETASITITALPVATFSYSSANHCQSEGTILPTFIGGGLAGTFTSSAGLVINGTTGEIDLASSTPGSYTVYNTIVAANGCPQVQEQYTIIVYANPDATIISSDADNTICAGETATLTVNPTNFVVTDATYVWLLNTNVIPGATSYQYNPTATGVYEVQITLNGCTNVTPITASFTVNFVPQATIDGTNLVKCINEVSVITVTPVNYTTTDPVTYSWTLDGGPLADTTNSISYDDYGTYEVTITNQGCSSTYAITVSPDTTEIPVDAIGECVGANYILTASPINGSFDPANVVYEWTNSNGDVVASGTNQNTFNVTQYVQDSNISSSSFPLTFTVRITTSPEGCTDTQDFVVLSSICTIPKGISPNGDGKNDSFNLRGLGVKHLSIFNRYGTKVYSYSNYTDQWHGQTDKGDELPVGTYYFVFEQNDGQNKSGWIYINK
ncbi:gliding motility-associated C-terminal domain-containing protein [Flavobacterium terrae]|uniref:Gliding motility-associated C-terminal domain-containing protein n=2 Tax=Flavobacterium terrae TaxID=415425 RepID=A0A1M6B1D0_9FLAO|nr:gliding motility-associated C-terminal domain-containing protein [Flavobacterium terrae]